MKLYITVALLAAAAIYFFWWRKNKNSDSVFTTPEPIIVSNNVPKVKYGADFVEKQVPVSIRNNARSPFLSVVTKLPNVVNPDLPNQIITPPATGGLRPVINDRLSKNHI